RMLQVRERAFGAREIDQHIAARRCGSIGADLHLARLGTDRGIAGSFERRAELELAVGEHGIDQRAPHPAAGAGERDLHRPAAGETTSPSTRASLPSLKYSASLRVSRLPFSVSRQ